MLPLPTVALTTFLNPSAYITSLPLTEEKLLYKIYV